MEHGRFRYGKAFAGKMPTHGVYNQSHWQLMGADAVALSLHHSFDDAVAVAAKLEINGGKCVVVCFDNVTGSPTLRILHVEDNEDDRLLVEREIARHWRDAQIQWVYSGRIFANALAKGPVDLVLCDNGGLQFDGKDALALTRIMRPGAAFIYVSGAPDERLEALKLTGADGVLGKHQLPRLKSMVDAAFQLRGRPLP